MTVVRIDCACCDNRSLFLKAQVIAVLQMDGLVGMPAVVTALDQRRTVKRSQTGEQSQRQAWSFAETERPTILNGFEYRGWTFDDGDFIVHSNGNHTIKPEGGVRSLRVSQGLLKVYSWCHCEAFIIVPMSFGMPKQSPTMMRRLLAAGMLRDRPAKNAGLAKTQSKKLRI
jgi:hypothetical protein